MFKRRSGRRLLRESLLISSFFFCTQGPFDILIHKATAWIVDAPKFEASARKLKDLCDYTTEHKETLVLDHPDKVRLTSDRWTLYQLLSHHKIEIDGKYFGMPESRLLVKGELDKYIADPKLLGLQFPLICKPRVACKSEHPWVKGEGAHDFLIVLRAEGLGALRRDADYVIQEYVNHSGLCPCFFYHKRAFSNIFRFPILDLSFRAERSITPKMKPT